MDNKININKFYVIASNEINININNKISKKNKNGKIDENFKYNNSKDEDKTNEEVSQYNIINIINEINNKR